MCSPIYCRIGVSLPVTFSAAAAVYDLPTTAQLACKLHLTINHISLSHEYAITTASTSSLIVGPWTSLSTYRTLFDTFSLDTTTTTPAQCASPTTLAPPRRRRQHACSRPSTNGPISTAPPYTSRSRTHASLSLQIFSWSAHAPSCLRSNDCFTDPSDRSRSNTLAKKPGMRFSTPYWPCRASEKMWVAGY